jgi:TldD protein
MYYDYRPMVTLGAVCIMEENGKVEKVMRPELTAWASSS